MTYVNAHHENQCFWRSFQYPVLHQERRHDENRYQGTRQLLRSDDRPAGRQDEDIKAELNDGYLTVSAENNTSKDEKDDNGKYICRERYSGSYSRSFYVGDAVTEQDISAKFENGTLKLTVPKKESLPEKQNKYIAIGW